MPDGLASAPTADHAYTAGVLSLTSLARLADHHRGDLATTVGPLTIGDEVFDVDVRPIIMGVLNLSRDSTYRESIATSTASAVRKARVMAADGAAVVDVGAESSTAGAIRVDARRQIAALVPVIERLADEGLLVSAETYEQSVAAACLKAGARVLNLTGRAHETEILTLAAEHGATVILCYVGGANVREVTDLVIDADPLPALAEHFAERVAVARDCGVQSIVIDPGMGFYYGNLVDPMTRVEHQARVLLNSFRLRTLGLPLCNAMPHAFDLFEEQFRTAEGFFTVLGILGGTQVIRTHEVARVRAVVDAMQALDTGWDSTT